MSVSSRKSRVARNLDLAENHLMGILEHPERLSGSPDEAEIIFLPADDPELLEANLAMANQIIREMSRNGPQELSEQYTHCTTLSVVGSRDHFTECRLFPCRVWDVVGIFV